MAVDIFFLLSGVVIDASYRGRLVKKLSPLRFIWLRIVRIYPLYILGTAIAISAVIISPNHQLLDGSSPIVFSHKVFFAFSALLLLPNLSSWSSGEFPYDGPAWSLFFELLINVFYGFIVRRLSNRMLVGLILIFSLLLLFSLVHFHEVEMGWRQNTFIAGIFRTGASFFLGVALYRFYLYMQTANVSGRAVLAALTTKRPIILSVIIIVATVVALTAPVSRDSSIFLYVFCVFMLFPALIFLSLWIEPNRFLEKIWLFLGDTSYAIYTLHAPLYLFMCSVIGGYTGILVGKYAPYIGFFYIVFLLCLAYVIDCIYDKPVRSMLKKF